MTEADAGPPAAPGEPGSWQPDYDWNLRALMADRHLWKSTELIPLLRQRGIGLSISQVRRLVTGTPQRLSLDLLAALCDILGCTPADLITVRIAASIRQDPPGTA